jgi:hypothetical protein
MGTVEVDDEVHEDLHLQLSWLAGLLEAEGTFLRPVSSKMRAPAVACLMTDQDTVERVGTLFGTGVFEHRRSVRTRPMFSTRLRGFRAAQLMNDLLPLMGQRRRAAINEALDSYKPPVRKLSFASAAVIRWLLAHDDVTVSELSRQFGVARSTIREIRDGRIYKARKGPPWRHDLVLPRLRSLLIDYPEADLYWLAGWLEGEGSFCKPPPSDPRRARVLGCTKDRDVATRVAHLLGASPRYAHPASARKRGWSPVWRILVRGTRAVRVMKALHPLMGSRRQNQIATALATVGERAD